MTMQVAGFLFCSLNISCSNKLRLRKDILVSHLGHTLSQVKNETWRCQDLPDFCPPSVCPLCGLVAYTGPPDVALMMPLYEDCCVSAESD